MEIRYFKQAYREWVGPEPCPPEIDDAGETAFIAGAKWGIKQAAEVVKVVSGELVNTLTEFDDEGALEDGDV